MNTPETQILTKFKNQIDKFSKDNKPIITKYVLFLFNERREHRTIEKHLTSLKLTEKLLNNINLAKTDKKDAELLCAKINGSGYSERYKEDIKVNYKAFKRYVSGGADAVNYPEDVSWIRRKKLRDIKKVRLKTPEDLLTEKEQEQLLRACTTDRDKALIMVLIEMGLRPKEVLSLKIKNVQLSNSKNEVSILTIPQDNKTGTRHVPFIKSKPLLVTLLNKHPLRENPNAPLWLAQKKKKTEALTSEGLRNLFRRLMPVAGIKKRVHPYLFRHTSYTNKARQGWSEQQIKKYHGLGVNSSALVHYVRMSDEDLKDVVLVDNGIMTKTSKRSIINLIECPNCGTENVTTDDYCKKCGSIVNLKLAEEKRQDDLEKEEKLNKLASMLTDDNVKKLLKVYDKLEKEAKK